MPSERYEILLPLKYNDGSSVEPEKFQQTRRELVQKFGALTMEVQPISARISIEDPKSGDFETVQHQARAKR